jgi:uncharacterized membrane-anchored protein YitT (DUF2179 family)
MVRELRHSSEGLFVQVSVKRWLMRTYIVFMGTGLMCVGISIQVCPPLCLSMSVFGVHQILNALIEFINICVDDSFVRCRGCLETGS